MIELISYTNICILYQQFAQETPIREMVEYNSPSVTWVIRLSGFRSNKSVVNNFGFGELVS